MLDASLEVRSAVVYGSLIVVLVFIPVFLLDGLAGSFFRPLALSYVLAILASLFVALTVTPAMSLLLLPKHAQAREAPAVRWLKARYRRILPRPDRRAEARDGDRRGRAAGHGRAPSPSSARSSCRTSRNTTS